MDHSDTIWRAFYFCMAAAAGAVTALASSSWKQMTKVDIALTLVAGFSFAIFVAPWVAHELLGIPSNNIRGVAALTYVFGSGSNILLPVLIRKIKSMVGEGADR